MLTLQYKNDESWDGFFSSVITKVLLLLSKLLNSQTPKLPYSPKK